jgi:hypothetical protein
MTTVRWRRASKRQWVKQAYVAVNTWWMSRALTVGEVLRRRTGWTNHGELARDGDYG